MYNYYSEVIWRVDLILIGIIAFIAVAIIFYSLAKEFVYLARSRALLKIKQNVYELVLTGNKGVGKSQLDILNKTSPGQFLDVLTNRNREAVFFNDAEQRLFRESFVSEKKILQVKKIACNSINKWRRIEAILSLGYAGIESGLDIFKKTVMARDQDLVYFSIIALGQIKTIGSVKILLEALKKNPTFRYKIVSALQEFPSDMLCDVIKLTSDRDSNVRLWALRLIAKCSCLQYIDELIALTSDKDEEVRAGACDVIGTSGIKDAKDAIIKCLKDNSWLVREHAVSALSNLIKGDSMPLIAGLIDDGSLSVLASIKDAFVNNINASLPFIIKLLQGQDDLAKKICIEALDDSGCLPALFKLILSGSQKEKEEALQFLNSIIKAHGHFCIETALNTFAPDEARIILDEITKLDRLFSEHLEKKARKEIKEI